jgi:uncharacterized DUF497 family protein
LKFEWDAAKAEANLGKHGVPFEDVRSFVFDTAVAVRDDRRDYGEIRMIALGFIGDRLHHLVYTRRGEAIRVISLRKANVREIRTYVRTVQEF